MPHKDHLKNLTYKRAWRLRHQKELAARQRTYNRRLKLAVFTAYGGPICCCCGETHLEFLTLDHIAGDGAVHRRKTRDNSGRGVYHDLKKHNYPPGFRVLCFNCNCSLGYFGYCPHGNVQVDRPQSVVQNGYTNGSNPQQLSLMERT